MGLLTIAIVRLSGLYFSASTHTIILSSSSLVRARIVSISSIFASFKISSSRASPHITIEDVSSEAISSALDSPLLNDNRITGAKNVLLLIVSGKEEITIDEIGLINDYIQEKAGHGANIIMGVGEDLSLENSISVTVIATGFDPNQQDEIIHSDPKKIIHNLDENSGYVHNLNSDILTNKKDSLQFDFTSNSIDFKNTNSEIENSENSKLINDIHIDYEELNLTISEDEIEINDIPVNVNKIEVIKPEEVEPIDQVSFDFDMPLKKQIIESDKIVHELIEDVNEIEVNNSVHIIPVTEVNGINANKSGIDDYEIESKLTEPSLSDINIDNKEIVLNPLNSSIADGLSKRTEERKIKLKEYNYNFAKANNIKSMENEPAFKRSGVSLDNVDQFKSSRTVVSEDSNGEINLRTNNSFLHDNVD